MLIEVKVPEALLIALDIASRLLELRPDAPPARAMSLNAFAAKQKLEFQIVAKKTEDSWSQRALCARLLLSDGTEVELQAVKEALRQWAEIPKGVVHVMDVTRACVRPYTGSDKTGIKAKFFLRMMYANGSLTRGAHGFHTHAFADRKLVRAPDLAQVGNDVVFNVAGIVHSGGAPPPQARGNALPRRTIELLDKDWQLSVDFVGDLSNAELAAGAKVVVVSCKKKEYCGVLSLETTRLSYVIMDPPWATIEAKPEGSPVRKALKSETLNFVTIDTAKASSGDAALRVKASRAAFTDDLFEKNIWVGDSAQNVRLPLVLRDQTGTMTVAFWSNTFGQVIPHNVDELNTMWEACGNGDAAKATLLNALNTSVNKSFSWTLRPSKWTRTDGEVQIQWHVHAVANAEGDEAGGDGE